MSAFVLSVDRDRERARVAADEGECALGGFGGLGWHRIEAPGFAARQSRSAGVVPSPSSGGVIVLIDGAFSARCRQTLNQQFAADDEAQFLEDRVLVARAWECLREQSASLFDGDFAFALFDVAEACLWLLRSRSGARALHVVRDGERVFAATQATAALRVAGKPLRENPEAIAAYFALRAPVCNAAYLQEVAVLAAGEWRVFSLEGARIGSMPSALSSSLLHFADDREAGLAWNEVLRTAVADDIASAQRPGVMLSGGIDSSMLAVFGKASRPDLLACSWQLAATPSADEYAWSSSTAAGLQLEQVCVDGDPHWPLARLRQWSVEDDGPLGNPYAWLQTAVYAAAAQRGCDRLMSGNFGDHLYPESAAWLRSGLADRGMSWVLDQQWNLLREQGVTALWREPGWRALLRPAQDQSAAAWQPASWLQDDWRVQLLDLFGATAPSGAADAAEAVQDASFGRRAHCRYGIELSTPYRDPRVIAFAASLPAHFQYRRGQPKWLSREIMRERLPEAVRVRPKGGSLVPFFKLGVLQQAAADVALLLDAPDARWPNYVKPQALQRARAEAREEADLLLIWLCTSYELWWRAHWAEGPAVLASAIP